MRKKMENNDRNDRNGQQSDFDNGSFRSYETDYEDKTGEPDGGESGEERYTFEALDGKGPRTRAWAIASLVLGIFSLLCCCLSWGAAAAGLLAVIFAVVSRRTLGYFDALSIVGLITGIVGIIFGVYMGILYTSPEFAEIIDQIKNGMDAGGSGSGSGGDSGVPGDPNATFALPFLPLLK